MITSLSDDDEKLSAMRNRRKLMEEQRKERIFNPRQRLIGIDSDALKQQVQEGKFRKAMEKQKEQAFAERLKQCDETAAKIEETMNEEARKLAIEIDRFRLTEQKPEHRRDFDLYDPDLMKKELPARVSDDDSSSTVSSIQKLFGEDIEKEQHDKERKAEYRDYLMKQMKEKRLQSESQKTERLMFQKRMRDMDQQANLLAEQEKETRRKNTKETVEFNKQLAAEQETLKKQLEMDEEGEFLEELGNIVYGRDFLDKPNFWPPLSTPRHEGEEFDGCWECHEELQAQIIESKMKREREKLEKDRWESMMLDRAREASLLEESQQSQKADQNKEQQQVNLQLAQEQNIQLRQLDDFLYTNEPTEDYFDQFNTSTR